MSKWEQRLWESPGNRLRRSVLLSLGQRTAGRFPKYPTKRTRMRQDCRKTKTGALGRLVACLKIVSIYSKSFVLDEIRQPAWYNSGRPRSGGNHDPHHAFRRHHPGRRPSPGPREAPPGLLRRQQRHRHDQLPGTGRTGEEPGSQADLGPPHDPRCSPPMDLAASEGRLPRAALRPLPRRPCQFPMG